MVVAGVSSSSALSDLCRYSSLIVGNALFISRVSGLIGFAIMMSDIQIGVESQGLHIQTSAQRISSDAVVRTKRSIQYYTKSAKLSESGKDWAQEGYSLGFGGAPSRG